MSVGVLDAQICDHSLIYAILRLTAPRFRSRKILTRSLKNFDGDTFRHDLQVAPFHIMDIFDEVDDKVYVFNTLFLDIANEHQCSVKTVPSKGKSSTIHE